ncbi:MULTISPECIES: ATP-binding protein [unclassified Streptomyces]|uniref:ATP-binding protein n=1 Tax=unclassified Streptomyces TaxID=2593676 RepID=UPI0004780679|nr:MULTISPECIES: ATP-binding protein [unclassified Streptomyces]MYT30921.1 ATP-binding protein [Streptomyces sp. SID8354]
MTQPLYQRRHGVHVLWRWTRETPHAAKRARAALSCALDELGYGGEAVVDAVLAASELIANALEHAPGPYEMRLRFTAADLICEVVDRDPRIPAVPGFPATAPFEPAPEKRGGGIDALLEVLSERGRGLHIVNQLTCGAWGFVSRRREGVKVAWIVVAES